MGLLEQIIELQEAFAAVAGMVGKDADNMVEVVKAVYMRLDLLRVYEEALRLNINPLEAAEMRDLAAVVVSSRQSYRLSRLNNLRAEAVSRSDGVGRIDPSSVRKADLQKDDDQETKIDVYSEEHREKIRKAWKHSAERTDQKIIDTPFEEYAEEFTDYLAMQLAELKVQVEEKE